MERLESGKQVSTPQAAEFPSAVKQILQDGLQLRDRRDQDQIGERGMAIAAGKIEARLDRVLQLNDQSDANRRLGNHLLRERDAIFSFLRCPGLDATNYRAEQAIRPMVVTRKTWGGNRTQTGAHTQSVLTSILQTCRQQLRSPIDTFQHLLCSPQPQVLELTLPPLR